MRVESSDPTRVGDNTYHSSSRLAASWNHAPQPVDHYEITANDGISSSDVFFSIDASASSTILTDLKSGTEYAVLIRACLDTSCDAFIEGDSSASETTAEEIWQIQGEGNSYKTALQIVPDGTTAPYVFRYGEAAGTDLAGAFQIYYNAQASSPWGPGVRSGYNQATNANAESLTSFTLTENGIQRCDPVRNSGGCPQGALRLTTFQAVPLAEQETIRFYFEAAVSETTPAGTTQEPGADLPNVGNPTTRIYSLDSHDGYGGQDFNPNEGTNICEESDFIPGGDCDPTVIVGVEGDELYGDSGLTHARQFKIGYPVLDEWAWDGAAGTFMVITGADSCGLTLDGQFYAVWDGGRWIVDKDTSGCARPFATNGHGPVVVHLGASRYKLYYEDTTAGRDEKPLHLIYADGARTGEDTLIEFEDWEPAASAHDVHFLWPNGDPVNATAESGLGDHFIFLPTGNPDEQIMYMNLGGLDNSESRGPSLGIGMATLLNP